MLADEAVVLWLLKEERNKLKHEGHLLYVYDFRDFPGLGRAICTDFAHCETLSHLIAKPRSMSFVEIEFYFGGLIDAIADLHRNEFSHNDVKPSNILMKADKRIEEWLRKRFPGVQINSDNTPLLLTVLADFGLCKSYAGRTTFDRCGGTRLYMPFEALMGQSVACEIPDLFAAGVCLYEIITGRDQIAAHAQFLHGFIMPELSNRIIQRCPMHLQGCDEFQTRFVAPGGFRLAFNAFLDSFVLRQPTDSASRDHLHDNQASCDINNGISLLLQVPEVILHRILSQLDSASLYCLSATCSFLRDACAFFLPLLGVTDFEWRRVVLPPDNSGPESVPGSPVQSQPLPVVHVTTRLEFECGVRSVTFSKSKRFVEPITGQNGVRWVPGPQRWRFTKMIEPVKECNFALSTIGEHIQHCPFYKPLRRYGRVKMYPELDLSESCTDEEIL